LLAIGKVGRGNIRDIQEPILVLVLLVDGRHEGGCRWQHLVHEYEDGLFRRELNSLPDHIDELANREVCWYQILLLIDGSDVRLLYLLTYDLSKQRLAGMLLHSSVNATKGGKIERGMMEKGEHTGMRSLYF